MPCCVCNSQPDKDPVSEDAIIYGKCRRISRRSLKTWLSMPNLSRNCFSVLERCGHAHVCLSLQVRFVACFERNTWDLSISDLTRAMCMQGYGLNDHGDQKPQWLKKAKAGCGPYPGPEPEPGSIYGGVKIEGLSYAGREGM